MDQSTTNETSEKNSPLSENLPLPPPPKLTAEQLDIEILPVIYDIIRCVEKDPVDNAGKQKESQECAQKILELQSRLESVRNKIKELPGIDYNKEEQLQKFEQLQNQLKLKKELIKKYKNTQF